jgi:hypothetical protein
LRSLVTLRLATLPSWDSSGRTTAVSSIEPITALPNLLHLELFGIVPPKGSLGVLDRCPALLSVRLHKFDGNEVSDFYARNAVSDEFAPLPPF